MTVDRIPRSGLLGRFFSLVIAFRQTGIKLMLRATIWRFNTFLFKKLIGYQDRLGLFTYGRWCKENETSQEDLDKQRSAAVRLQSKPLFSILLPVNTSNIRYIYSTLDSLHSQTYPNWEACIFPWGVENLSDLASFFEHFSSDPRIRLINPNHQNGISPDIAGSVRSCVGNHVVFMYAGDTLSADALFCAAEQVNQTPAVDILYSDEDHLSQCGQKRRAPFLKPDWSPELLLSVNYLVHGFIQRDLLVSVSEESKVYGEAIFRCVEKTRQIVHIPKILYHVRDIFPDNNDAWICDFDQYCQLVEGHLKRGGIPSARAFLQDKRVRVKWTVEKKLISIVIPNKDRSAYLERCIASLMAVTRYQNYEIVVMDNESKDPATWEYYKRLEQLPNIKVIENHQPFNFSAYNNQGACHARGELLLFLNNDIEVIDPDWLDELACWAGRPEIGVVGAKLLYPDGLIQHTGIILGLEGHASHVFLGMHENDSWDSSNPFGSTYWYRDYSAVTGACMMFKRRVFEEVGGFNEDYQLVFSDIEICLRVIQAGYRVMYNPFARLIHHEGKTRHNFIPPQDIELGYEHFKEIVENGDPYYNPGLSYSVRIPTLKRRGEETPIRRLQHIVEFTHRFNLAN